MSRLPQSLQNGRPANAIILETKVHLLAQKLDTQNAAHQALEAKIGALVGFVGIIIVFVFDLNNISGGPWLYVTSLIAIVTSFILLIIGARPRGYVDPPTQSFVDWGGPTKPIDTFMNETIEDIEKAIAANQKVHNTKAKYFRWAINCLAAGILLLTAEQCLQGNWPELSRHITEWLQRAN